MRARPMKKRRQATQLESRRIRPYLVAGAIVLGIAALGALLYLSLREPAALEGLRRFAGLSRGHDETVEYPEGDLPPVGGIHSGTWQNCGIYTEPLETKHAMHSLEHGAVWLTYQPELPDRDVERLQDLVRGESFVVMSPYPGLKSPVVLTAWGIQLEVEAVGDGRIADFVERYQQGPQTPELGASCQNGTGTPIS